MAESFHKPTGRVGGRPEYYTQYFSLSKPLGVNVFEFLIVAKDEIGATSKLTGELARHNVDILSIAGANDFEIGLFVLTLFCDFAKADCTAAALAGKVWDLPFVTKVDFRDAKGRLFDGYRYPLRIMNKHRGILMRAGPLLATEKNLVKMLGSAGASIMFEEGRTYAHAVMGHLKGALPDAIPEEIFMNVVDGLRVTGWGLFQFHEEPDTYRITVSDPPKLRDGFQSMFVRGIAVGTTETICGSNLAVRSADYDEKTDTLTLILESKEKR